MMSLENENKVLKENNNELVQKVQYWKMTAAQRENENVELMKEITDLRLKLSRLKNAGDDEAHNLYTAVQRSSEAVLTQLVQASNEVTRTMDFVKTYIHKRQVLESSLPRWSTISEGQSPKKTLKVRPMVAGRSVQQPFVLLDRSVVGRNQRNREIIEDQNHSVADRAIPMHMLLDVYIPLRRIDAEGIPAPGDGIEDDEQDPNDSAENLGLEGAEEEAVDEFENVTPDEAFEETRGLQAVSEESEEEAEQTPQRSENDDPLEGPSWLLDRPNSKVITRRNLEPDSTTGTEDADSSAADQMINKIRRNSQVMRDASAECGRAYSSPSGASVFSPTVRRRRATPPPPATPRSPHPARRSSNINGRVLKVLVPKIHLDGSPMSPHVLLSPTLPLRRDKRRAPDAADSPLKRPNIMRFDAPSPNGATDSKVIVMETNCSQPEPGGSGASVAGRQSIRDNRPADQGVPDRRSVGQHRRESRPDDQSGPDRRSVAQAGRDSRPASQSVRDCRPADQTGRDSRSASQSVRDSDSEGEMLADRRPRRQKKAVVYKEKPLNRKMRR